MTKDEALKLAEQSIKDLMFALAEGRVEGDNYQPAELEAFSVLNAIKKALAQDEQSSSQEPVATVTSESGNPDIKMSWWHEPALTVGTKLYTTSPKPEWVGLTDDERSEIESNLLMDGYGYPEVLAAIEAKLKAVNGFLKEKNT